MPVTPTQLAKELNVGRHKVVRLIKWYAISRGENAMDFYKKALVNGRVVRGYIMPDDFREFVIRELNVQRRDSDG